MPGQGQGQNFPQQFPGQNFPGQNFGGQFNGQGFPGGPQFQGAPTFPGQPFLNPNLQGQGFSSQGFNSQSFNGQGFNGQGFNGQGFNGPGFNGPNFNGQNYLGSQGYLEQAYRGLNYANQGPQLNSFEDQQRHLQRAKTSQTINLMGKQSQTDSKLVYFLVASTETNSTFFLSNSMTTMNGSWYLPDQHLGKERKYTLIYFFMANFKNAKLILIDKMAQL